MRGKRKVCHRRKVKEDDRDDIHFSCSSPWAWDLGRENGTLKTVLMVNDDIGEW